MFQLPAGCFRKRSICLPRQTRNHIQAAPASVTASSRAQNSHDLKAEASLTTKGSLRDDQPHNRINHTSARRNTRDARAFAHAFQISDLKPLMIDSQESAAL